MGDDIRPYIVFLYLINVGRVMAVFLSHIPVLSDITHENFLRVLKLKKVDWNSVYLLWADLSISMNFLYGIIILSTDNYSV